MSYVLLIDMQSSAGRDGIFGSVVNLVSTALLADTIDSWVQTVTTFW
jgi:hypothetical protein